MYEKFDQTFHFLCLIATAALLIWCCIEYSKNDNVVQLSFKKLGFNNEIAYPDISFCIENWGIFSQDDLERWKITSDEYHSFLTGTNILQGTWNKSLAMLDYDNVTWRLKDHLIKQPYVTLSDSSSKRNINEAAAFGNGRYKCSTLSLPREENILSLTVPIRKSLFPEVPRPMSNFRIRLHSRQQIFRSWHFDYSNWPSHKNASSDVFKVEFNIKDVEVLSRRNRREMPCVDNDFYDQIIIDEILTKVGCAPPYLKNTSKFHPCSTMRTMEQLSNATTNYFYGIGETENVSIPCMEIIKIGIDSDIRHVDPLEDFIDDIFDRESPEGNSKCY